MNAAAGIGAAGGGSSSAFATDGNGAAVEPFPWEAVIHAGLCLLRLPPRDFWALSPKEFHAMTGGSKGRAPKLDRAGLEALMHAFPDR